MVSSANHTQSITNKIHSASHQVLSSHLHNNNLAWVNSELMETIKVTASTGIQHLLAMVGIHRNWNIRRALRSWRELEARVLKKDSGTIDCPLGSQSTCNVRYCGRICLASAFSNDDFYDDKWAKRKLGRGVHAETN